MRGAPGANFVEKRTGPAGGKYTLGAGIEERRPPRTPAGIFPLSAAGFEQLQVRLRGGQLYSPSWHRQPKASVRVWVV